MNVSSLARVRTLVVVARGGVRGGEEVGEAVDGVLGGGEGDGIRARGGASARVDGELPLVAAASRTGWVRSAAPSPSRRVTSTSKHVTPARQSAVIASRDPEGAEEPRS